MIADHSNICVQHFLQNIMLQDSYWDLLYPTSLK